ncbi:MAG TPA: hypothetical protein VNJ12_13000 [Candidatus Dormibacteraeota bacterium]|nr:hypothetical protein [Candidatus Dormibacteraeota bacterium]
MAKIDLRPMTLGEVLDRTFSLYKGNFWLFAGIVAVPYFLIVIFSVFYSSTLVAVIPAAGKLATPAAMGRLLGATLAGGSFFLLIYLCVFAAAQAATVVAVSDLYLGRAASLRGSYARVAGRIPTVLLVMALVFLMVGAGMIFFIVPGVLLLCRTAIAVPAATLEDTGVRESISRSVRLTKGSSAEIFAVYALTLFLAVVASFVFHLPVLLALGSPVKPHALPLWLSVVDGLGSWLAGVIVAPIGTIAFSLIYYNLRIRKEAFDIEQLLSSLESDSPPASPSPA